MDAKVFPEEFPDAPLDVDEEVKSSENLDEDFVDHTDYNDDPHGKLRPTDPMYPSFENADDDDYETDESSDLEEDATGSPTHGKKKKKHKMTDAEQKSAAASGAFGQKRRDLKAEILSIVLEELIPQEETMEMDSTVAKPHGWFVRSIISCGKFFGCLTLDLHEAVLAGNDAFMNNSIEKVTGGKKSRRGLLNVYNRDGVTPLSLAVKTKQPNICFALCSRNIDVDVPDIETGRTPLWFACMHGIVSMTKMLADKGADPNFADNNATSPLMMACRADDHRSVRHIMGMKIRLDIDAQDYYGWTALHYAANRNAHRCIKILTDNGAERNLKDAAGRKAIHIARMRDYGDSVAALEDVKARLAFAFKTEDMFD